MKINQEAWRRMLSGFLISTIVTTQLFQIRVFAAVEGVALIDVAGLKPFFEPVHALSVIKGKPVAYRVA